MVPQIDGGKKQVNITIEEGSGFCFGVSRVIEMAEEILERGESLYCLGEIVHNEKEVKRLVDMGMKFIEVEDLNNLSDTRVMIRAHGEPPSTYEICEKNNISIVDGTCPIVKNLQKKVRKSYETSDPANEQIVIYGKKDHPEVIGLNGQTGNNSLIISKAEELENVDLKKGITLFSQTTMDSKGFQEVAMELNKRNKNSPNGKLMVKNTICNHISHRQPGIISFARNNELIIFVAGKNSSNGKILFEICKKENPNCIFISETNEIQKKWFTGYRNIGITGGTSTPEWLLKQTARKIEEITG